MQRTQSLAVVLAVFSAICSGDWVQADGLTYSAEPWVKPIIRKPRAYRAEYNEFGYEQRLRCAYDDSVFETVGQFGNEPNRKFGCANQAALRSMLADKRDLYRGRGTRNSDGERAANIVQKYREGPTSSKQSTSSQSSATQ